MQHNVNCRLAQAVVVPEAIPPERLDRYGARRKLRRYAGLKEEYYLADFEPDPAVLTSWASTARSRSRRAHAARGLALSPLRERPVRRRPAAAARHADRGAAAGRPRSAAQLGGFIVPERAIDAQSLIAYADLVIRAGGTMNREAVALGTPVFTTFEGRPGAVDERLIARVACAAWSTPSELELVKRAPERPPSACGAIRALLVDLLCSPAA